MMLSTTPVVPSNSHYGKLAPGLQLYGRVSGEKMVPLLAGLLTAIQERNPEGLPAGEFLHRTDPNQLRSWIGIEDGE